RHHGIFQHRDRQEHVPSAHDPVVEPAWVFQTQTRLSESLSPAGKPEACLSDGHRGDPPLRCTDALHHPPRTCRDLTAKPDPALALAADAEESLPLHLLGKAPDQGLRRFSFRDDSYVPRGQVIT